MSEWDETIAGRIRRGEPRAFDELFERWGARLLAYLEGLVRERAAAEDLLQETFVRVWRHIGRYEERGTFRAWLYRTATNLALSELRRRRIANARPLGDEALEVAEPREGPEARAAGRARDAAVARALASLDDEHRVVVLLRVREEMSVRDVARVLNVPEGTVKSRMHHAVRRLRAAIEEEPSPPDREEPCHDV